MLNFLTALQHERFRGTLVGANAAADTEFKVEHGYLTTLVFKLFFVGLILRHHYGNSTLGLREIFEVKCIHRAALNAETAANTGIRVGTHTVVGWCHAFSVPQLVKRLEHQAAALAATTDSIYPFLIVGYTMNQPVLSGLAQNFVGFLAGNLTPQVILNSVASKLVKVEAILGGVLTTRRVRVDVLPVPAGTVGDSKILLGIQHLDHFFVG